MKGHEARKSSKKSPLKNPAEKRAEKRIKKANHGLLGSHSADA